MHALAEIVKSVEKDGDTWLVVRLPKSRLKEEIENKTITNTEMRFDDGRHISNLQRKKAYATIRQRVDDSGYRKICLCRTHHRIAHQRGMPSFEKMYHVYGIIVDDSPEGKS